MCGTVFPLPEAAHIIDEKEWKTKVGADRQVNGMPLCPSCHKVFDDVLRPYLYRALNALGTREIPESWKKSNKSASVTDEQLPLEDET